LDDCLAPSDTEEENGMAGSEVKTKLLDAMPWRSDQRSAHRIERLEEENERLETENAALRHEFKESRSLQERMLQALESPPVIKVKKRGRRLFRTLVIAGGACLVGMRLGREGYDRLVDSVKDRLSRSAEGDVVNVPEPSDQVEPTARAQRSSSPRRSAARQGPSDQEGST
jgi:hypothetical protein